MTEPMMYRVRSRLSQQALNGRGVNVGAALRRAEVVFQTLSAPCLLEIDRCLAEMDAAFGPDARHRNDADLEALYLLSSRVIDVSHCLPTSGVDQAARALCGLVDACVRRGVKDWPAIELHIKTIATLRTIGQSLPEEVKANVLDGLASVRRKRVQQA